MIISNILATDMKEHFDMIKAFKLFLEQSDQKVATEEQSIIITTTKDYVKLLDWNEEDVKMMTGYIIHLADLSGPTKSFDMAFKWSQKVSAEFTLQV